MRVTVPGNILLTGEYMVTEPGGLGIAAAIEKRILILTEESDTFELHGNWGEEYLFWTLDHPEKSKLFTHIVNAFSEQYSINTFPAIRILADTRAFFAHGNRKRGFGSSAAVSVGITYVLQTILLNREPKPEETFALALKAHRAYQGGRGSGYDIAVSVYGGIGVFSGGELPTYRRINDSLFAVTLVQGLEPVSTSDAIDKYIEWKQNNHEQWQNWFELSNRYVKEMSTAESYTEAADAFIKAKQLGLELGKAIGVSAHFKPVHPSDGQFLGLSPYKSVGAGNELAVVLVKERTIAPFSIAENGVVREE